MKLYSTSQAAKRLGIGIKTLSRYIADKKVPAPKFMQSGKVTHHVWTEDEVEELRKLLPKIANGRKTRWQRQRQAGHTKAKKKAQARAPAVHARKKK
jgi:predicted site-specific integrase-resolvase